MFDAENSKQGERKSFIAGMVSGVALVVVLGGVFLLGANFNGTGISWGGGGGGAGNGAVAGNPTQPTQPGPEGNFDAIAKVSNDDHILGNSKAKVTLIEYSDFECPFCQRFNTTLKQVMADYKDQVRIVYRHFPLRSLHPSAQKAAEASECASAQGKFWEMHDKLFELGAARTLSVDTMKNAANELGLNTGKFDSCLDDGAMVGEVDKDYNDGLAGGVSGTPGSFINGQYVAGALPIEQLKPIIDAALKS